MVYTKKEEEGRTPWRQGSPKKDYKHLGNKKKHSVANGPQGIIIEVQKPPQWGPPKTSFFLLPKRDPIIYNHPSSACWRAYP